MPSTTRLIAALPGTVLYDQNGDRWEVEAEHALHKDGRTRGARLWRRDEYPLAQASFGPFRLWDEMLPFNLKWRA